MNDNRVSISTELDNGGIEKGAREIKGELGGIEGAVNDLRDALRSAFSGDFDKSIANANARVNELQRQLATVSVALKDAIADGDDVAAEKYGNQKIRIYDQLEAARERLANAVRASAQKEAEAEEREAQRAAKAAEKEANAKIKAAERAAAAERRAEEKQYKDATKSARRFGSRFKEIVSGALVFNLLSAGLREMTSYFGAALKSNEEFTKSFAQLKGALLTAFQPIYEAVLPALISLMRVLTAVVQVIGQFFALISGKSSGQMAANAEALNKEAKAISGVGGAAKKASKYLAGFDEIQKASGQNSSGGGSGGAGSGSVIPDFSPFEITDDLEHILYLVGTVGAALLTWKIASMFTSSLSLIAGLALSVGGAILYVFNIFDAFKNGIDWKNLSGMLLGVIALAGGLFLAFGAVGSAVGLIVAGVGLAVVSLREWITTGELSNAACAALAAGIIAIGGAISLLTHTWIPVLVAAVVAFVVAAVTKTEEFKAVLVKINDWLQNIFQKDWTKLFGTVLGTQLNLFFAWCSGIWQAITEILSGVIDFIAGVFTGDWEKAWGGVKDIFKGIVNGIIGVVNGLVRAVVNGINSVIRALNRINVSIPSWVPGFGGKKFGLNLSEIKAPQIPYLAQGAVLPPNKPFMAMVGDQRHGKNIEAPLTTIQEAVALVMGDQLATMMAGFEALLEENRLLREVVEGIEIGDEVLGKAANRYNTRLAVRRGDA